MTEKKKKEKKDKTKQPHYVDNKKFFEEMIRWKKEIESEEQRDSNQFYMSFRGLYDFTFFTLHFGGRE